MGGCLSCSSKEARVVGVEWARGKEDGEAWDVRRRGAGFSSALQIMGRPSDFFPAFPFSYLTYYRFLFVWLFFCISVFWESFCTFSSAPYLLCFFQCPLSCVYVFISAVDVRSEFSQMAGHLGMSTKDWSVKMLIRISSCMNNITLRWIWHRLSVSLFPLKV